MSSDSFQGTPEDAAPEEVRHARQVPELHGKAFALRPACLLALCTFDHL